jgi:hypothetical protein
MWLSQNHNRSLDSFAKKSGCIICYLIGMGRHQRGEAYTGRSNCTVLLIDRSIKAIKVNNLSKRLDELKEGLSRSGERNANKRGLFLKGESEGQ